MQDANYQDLSEDSLIVEEEYADHHYRTEIPNVIFDLNLDPMTLLVYSYLKRIIGDGGKCWQSIPNLAKKIGIGQTKLRECLTELIEGKNQANLRLVKKTQRVKSDGSLDTCVYTIINIWGFNGRFYRKGGTSPREGHVVRHAKDGGSPGEGKEEPMSKKNPLEELGNVLGDGKTMPATQGVNEDNGNEKSKFPLKKEQRAIFAKLKEFQLECDDDTLKFLVRKYSEQKINDALNHLKIEVAKGIPFKKGKIAFLRHLLNGNASVISEKASKNKAFVDALKKANRFPSLEIHEKYCICEKTHKELPYDMEEEEFKIQLKALFDLSKNY